MKETYLRQYFKEITKDRIAGSLELADLYRSYFRNINFNFPLISDAYWFHVYWACYAFNEVARAFNARMEIIIYEDRGNRVYKTKDDGVIGTLGFHVIYDGRDKHPELKSYIDAVMDCFGDDGDMEPIYDGSIFPKNFIFSPPPGKTNNLGFYDRYKVITGKTDQELRQGTDYVLDDDEVNRANEYYDSLEKGSDFDFDTSDVDDMFDDMKSEGSNFNMFDTSTNFEPAPWEKKGPSDDEVMHSRQRMAEIIKAKLNKNK